MRIIASLIIITILAYFFYFFGKSDSNLAVPIITYDKIETKIRPSDPGGALIPDMDKSVYNYIKKDKGEQVREKILPGPEKPIENIQDNNLASNDKNISLNSFVGKAFSIDGRLVQNKRNSSAPNRYFFYAKFLSPASYSNLVKMKESLFHKYNISEFESHVIKKESKSSLYNLFIGPFYNFSCAQDFCAKILDPSYKCIVIKEER